MLKKQFRNFWEQKLSKAQEDVLYSGKKRGRPKNELSKNRFDNFELHWFFNDFLTYFKIF